MNLATASRAGGAGDQGRASATASSTSVHGWEGPDRKRRLEVGGIPASESILPRGFGCICSRIFLVASFENQTFYFMLNIVRGSSGRFLLNASQPARHAHV